jgi:hypothetical protein
MSNSIIPISDNAKGTRKNSILINESIKLILKPEETFQANHWLASSGIFSVKIFRI